MSTPLLSPQRFRRRLTVVCILIAGVSAGVLASAAYVTSGHYRNRPLVLLGAWMITALLGASLGSAVARRALRPVRIAAESSRATAARLLGRTPPERDDEFDHWIASYNDIVAGLEQHVAEMSAVADRERRFTSDVAHELRTPLTGMVSAATLLEDQIDSLPAPARRPAELMIADARRLRDLVGELLELARIDAGADPIVVEPIDVTLALDAALHAWFAEADVRCQVAPGLRACADRTRFKRIVCNLVENALRHGRPPIAVRASQAGAYVRIEIVDAGEGVAVEDADRIFDRFYKADSGRARRGSGLGLAIAREHASAFGGSVTLANPGMAGACFVFALPALTSSSEANASDEDPTSREDESRVSSDA